MKKAGYIHPVWILMIIAVFGAGLKAQDKLNLSLSKALETGLANSKTLKISDAKVKQGRARLFEVNTNKFAWLKFSGSYSRLSKVDPAVIPALVPGGSPMTLSPAILNNYTAKFTVAQPLFMGNKITAGVDIAEQTLNATEQEYRKDKDELIVNIKNAYWSLYKAGEMKKVLDETVMQVQAHVADARNLLNAGLLTNNDVLKLEVQLSDIKYKQVDANNGVRLAMIALNNLLSIPLNTELEVTESVSINNSSFDNLDQLLTNSYGRRPELKAAEFRIKTGEAGVTVAQAGWFPQVSLVGNYNYARPNSRIFPTKDEFKDTWDVSLAVNFDLWDWNSRSYQTEQAEMQLLQAKEGLSSLKDGITLEVTQNFLNLNQAREKIKIAGLAKQQAEENYRITSDKFKQGLALSSDLIDAEVANVQAKTNFTTAMVDYEIAVAKLQKSTGDLSF